MRTGWPSATQCASSLAFSSSSLASLASFGVVFRSRDRFLSHRSSETGAEAVAEPVAATHTHALTGKARAHTQTDGQTDWKGARKRKRETRTAHGTHSFCRLLCSLKIFQLFSPSFVVRRRRRRRRCFTQLAACANAAAAAAAAATHSLSQLCRVLVASACRVRVAPPSAAGACQTPAAAAAAARRSLRILAQSFQDFQAAKNTVLASVSQSQRRREREKFKLIPPLPPPA